MPLNRLLPTLTAAFLAVSTSAAFADGDRLEHRITREGIAIELGLEPLDPERAPGELREGDDVRISLEVSDTHTGTPISTLYPAGWMDRLPAVPDPQADSCKTKVENFLGGSLLSLPELDLNVYYVVTMNEDGTLSVVDPLFGFGGSKLLTMVFLDSPAQDWALTSDQNRLFVSMPRSDRVAVVDTETWKVAQRIDVGRLPADVALQADGRALWVAFEGADDPERPSGVSVIDTESLEEVARLETGRGRHEIALSADGRHAFVTNSDDGTVSVIDAYRHRKLRDVAVGGRPISIAYSAMGSTAWVVDSKLGRVAAVDAASPEPRALLDAAPGLAQIRFPTDGRYGFAVNPTNDRLYVVDAARQRIIQEGQMESGPDQVTFSDELAYVRHRGSDVVLMVPFAGLGGEGEPIPVIDFPSGDSPAGATDMPSAAPSIVQAPGAPAVLIANPGDGAIYFYKEGMAAPMGHFKNYGRSPRAVTVVDRSLREIEPGRYQTTVKMRRPGRYELAVFVDSPRVVHCFDVEVGENPALARRERQGVEVALATDASEVPVGEEVKLRLEVRDGESGEAMAGLGDVNVLTFLSPGIWQRRQLATDVGDGRYEVSFTPHRPGAYYVFVEIRSQDLAFNRSPSLILRARAAETLTSDPTPEAGEGSRKGGEGSGLSR